ncbi:hypothetical protein VMHJH2_02225 [Streptococcus uberis]|uniref:hypothetical protein n=1 Tax=Streptococcus uberis TaxID=1349 RepID=UPI00214F84BD|nr:hypothetical protein [Streptococcus uberis]MCR4257328.1 hypothetical protein [Streptococcus uberis]
MIVILLNQLITHLILIGEKSRIWKESAGIDYMKTAPLEVLFFEFTLSYLEVDFLLKEIF